MADPHRPIYEVRDAVHGFIKLTEAEWAIVNCPTFQRLREIRQLAVAHYVYPGATHTRFEHSLGCLHLSELVFTALKDGEQLGSRPTFAAALQMSSEDVGRARRLLRLAALLHDLGHPPFSHSGEHLLPERPPHGPAAPPSKLTHEEMTATLIRESEIAEAIRRFYQNAGITAEHVVAVATKPQAGAAVPASEPMLWFLNDILTWDLGTDRMDYLLRDAHHSGQPTGAFDFRKLLDSFTIIPEVPGQYREDRGGVRLGIDSHGWLIAEQMAVARYLMYISLYFHKTKRIYEKHMERFLPHWLEREFGRRTFPTDVPTYTSLTESVVLSDLFRAARDPGRSGHRDAKPFVDRSHFRLAVELVLADNCHRTFVRANEAQPPIEIVRVPDKKRLDSFEEFVRMKFGDGVILDKADHSATKMFQAGHEVLVWDGQKPRYLGELSEIVRGMPQRVWRCRVYCPENRRDEVDAVCRDWLDQHPPGRTDLDARPSVNP
jgi:HD superfamily phosphohydrolase